MGLKKSKFTADTAIPAGSTFDFVINGQNFKITKEDLLTALGVTGTIEQEGAVTGTPVLDISGATYKIRNVETGDGIMSSLSPENGLQLDTNLIAGSNVSITPDGSGGLTIAAAVGAVANTVVVQSASDLPVASGGVHTLAVASYVIKGDIDLGSNVIFMPGGSQIIGDTATLSSITSSSASPTITAGAGGFAACAISGNGGLKINNTGGGAAVRAEDSGTILAIRRLFTSQCGTALEINNAGVLLDSWTVIGSVNGVVMTGSANTGPIINNFNPISLTGKGIYIDGNITSGALRINNALIQNVAGNAVEIASGRVILGMSFSGDATSTAGNGMKIAGSVNGGLLLENTNILSSAVEGMDIRGSSLLSITANAAGINSVAAGKSGLIGDAGSANIQAGGVAIFSASQINNPADVTATPLSGITKKDLQYSFTKAGSRLTDSRNIGSFTLSAQATTTINYQGFDGAITAYADSATSPGVKTTVTSAGHLVTSGAPVAITGTTAYNGLFTATNITANTFDIERVFVTNEATGNFESGWTKINGTTVAGESIERFDMPNNNELRSLDAKTLPVTYNSVIAGAKSGATARLYQFSVFRDAVDGNGFVKVDGSIPRDLTNRSGSLTIRIPTEAPTNSLFTAYVRNTETIDDFVCDALTTDIGLS